MATQTSGDGLNWVTTPDPSAMDLLLEVPGKISIGSNLQERKPAMTLEATPETAKAPRRRSAAKKVQGSSRSSRSKKAHTEKSAPEKRVPARIRIPNDLVNRIIETPSEKPTLDLLQAHLLFGSQSATKADRIVVTYNPDIVDQMREWCVRMIADSRHMEDGKAVAAAASRVVGFIDNFEVKQQLQ